MNGKRGGHGGISTRAKARAFMLCALALALTACARPRQTVSAGPTPSQTDSGAAVVQIPAFPAATATPEPTPTSAPDAEQTETPAPTSEPTAVPDPSETRYSSTTGLPLTGRNAYRPVLVAIRNDFISRPQTALLEADVVYEFAAEAMKTGFLAVYSDSYPERAGPVDSARAYTVSLQKEWKALFAYDGYPSSELKGYPGIKQGDIFVEANASKWPDFFVEDDDWRLALVAKLGTERYMSRTVSEQARFTFLTDVAYAEGEDFYRVGLPFMSNDTEKVSFIYDSGTDRLVRYENGAPCTVRVPNAEGGGYTARELSVQNLIVQYCAYSLYDNGYHRLLQLVGTGSCDYFVNGRHIEGTWERSSDTQYTRYRLSDGSALLLEPGNTWIVLQSAEKQIYIGY